MCPETLNALKLRVSVFYFLKEEMSFVCRSFCDFKDWWWLRSESVNVELRCRRGQYRGCGSSRAALLGRALSLGFEW